MNANVRARASRWHVCLAFGPSFATHPHLPTSVLPPALLPPAPRAQTPTALQARGDLLLLIVVHSARNLPPIMPDTNSVNPFVRLTIGDVTASTKAGARPIVLTSTTRTIYRNKNPVWCAPSFALFLAGCGRRLGLPPLSLPQTLLSRPLLRAGMVGRRQGGELPVRPQEPTGGHAAERRRLPQLRHGQHPHGPGAPPEARAPGLHLVFPAAACRLLATRDQAERTAHAPVLCLPGVCVCGTPHRRGPRSSGCCIGAR